MALLFSSFLLPLSACGTSVLGGGGTGGDTPGTAVGTGTVGSGPTTAGGAITALAMRVSDLPGGMLPWAGEGGPPGTGNSGPVPAGTDPDSLVVLFTNGSQSCAVPQMPTYCQTSDVWQMVLLVPAALDRVGPIDLGDGRITVTQGVYLGGAPGDCGFGSMFGTGLGGTPGGETLTIVGSEPTSLSVTLSGGVQRLGEVGANANIDGTYAVPRCAAAPPVPAPSPAIAVLGSKLPAGISCPTVGADVDPTALYVFLGTASGTCAAPAPTVDCNGIERTAFRLPEALQVPGKLSFPASELAAGFQLSSSAAPGCDPTSDYRAGAYPDGELDVLSIDATTLSFQIFGASNGGGFLDDPDGLYTATICP